MSGLKIQGIPASITPNTSRVKKEEKHHHQSENVGIHYQDLLDIENKKSQIPDRDNSVRFFFFSDVHSRQDKLNDFVQLANAQAPDLLIDGGDMVHDGTEAELNRAYAQRKAINSPVYIANGNHDEHTWSSPDITDTQLRVLNNIG